MIQSSSASEYYPMLGVRKNLYDVRNAYSAVVIHTTGHGPVTRVVSPKYAKWRRKYNIQDPLDAAVWIYRYAHNAGGHYLIGQEGRCYQLAEEELAVWQIGSGGARRYSRAWMSPKYDWWKERWPEIDSPYGLADGRLWTPYGEDVDVHPRIRNKARFGSANINCVGIEVVPPEKDTRGPWSDQAWSTLCKLVADICHRRDIPLKRTHVITHSDAHPLSRTTGNGQPWDPPPTQWSWEEFSNRYSETHSAQGDAQNTDKQQYPSELLV